MKILHIVAGELNGGAARGAYWLHRALRDLGLESRILGNARDIDGFEAVESLADSAPRKVQLALARRLGKAPIRLYRGRRNMDFNTGFDGIDISRLAAYADADLVHLHWVNGVVGVRSLRKLDKPVVWTLRDMWPMTGGCHHSLECDRYMAACGRCPQLASTREHDLTRLVLRRKQKALPTHMHIVGISHWMSECARKSSLFRSLPVTTIANNVDTRAFTPVEKAIAKQRLGLVDDRKVLLVGAQNVSNAYKGFDLFLDALKQLDKGKVQVLLFGKRTASIPDSHGIPSTNLGFLGETTALQVAYSAADVFIAPSRADAFGKTLVEAMACGTPAVCFDATGPKDIVEHGVDGYRAKPFSATDLAGGINWVLSRTQGDYRSLCDNARMNAERKFDSRVIAKRYVALYRDVLEGKSVDA